MINPHVSKTKIRKAVAEYMQTEGCDCCRDNEGHEKAKKKIALLLDVPKYEDGSGFDFYQFVKNE